MADSPKRKPLSENVLQRPRSSMSKKKRTFGEEERRAAMLLMSLSCEERLLVYPYMPNGNVADRLRDQSEDRSEPDMVLLEYLKQKETDSLAAELVPGVSPLPLEQHKEPNSVVSKQGLEILNSNKAYGHVSPKQASDSFNSTSSTAHAKTNENA
ncbi:hypothetical protein POM88_018003 [Heracleum sosnowskyi]|uniref:Uncharacterized protein n=1 Tax=Heracleum sosnowskyi TaxID=360622 RepID=A0AAD8IQ85_9APIA|nr:hypothetical protein POM88_018003 [Heracleum sosnowskyi]